MPLEEAFHSGAVIYLTAIKAEMVNFTTELIAASRQLVIYYHTIPGEVRFNIYKLMVVARLSFGVIIRRATGNLEATAVRSGMQYHKLRFVRLWFA